MGIDLYAEVEHAKYRDNLRNKIEKLGFEIVKEDTELSDEDLKDTLKTIKKLRK